MGKVTRGHGDTIEKGDAMHGKDDFVIKPKREEIVEIKASRSSENVGLTIAPNGFSIGDASYSWYDIEQFGVVRKLHSNIHSWKSVFWNYKSSSIKRNFEHKIARLLSGFDDGVDADDYQVEPEELARLLNDWRNRYTGSTSEIIIGTKMDRKISAKTYFLGVGLTIAVVIVILALFVINK